MAVLEKLGLFAHITFARSIKDASGVSGTEALIEGIDSMFRAGAEAIGYGEDPVTNGGDGENPAMDDGDEAIF